MERVIGAVCGTLGIASDQYESPEMMSRLKTAMLEALRDPP